MSGSPEPEKVKGASSPGEMGPIVLPRAAESLRIQPPTGAKTGMRL